MNAARKPHLLAAIREAECIGCTLCIQACPVDAILGSIQQTHTVIAEECIGCKLCLPPCPVDCIDLVPSIDAELAVTKQQKEKTNHIRQRYLARQKRLQQSFHQDSPDIEIRKAYIKDAVARIRKSKNPE